MKKLLLGSVASAFVVLPVGGLVHAADLPLKAPPAVYGCGSNSTIVHSNNQVSLDFIENNVGYREYPLEGFSAPTFSDTENGWMPGLSVTGSVMGDIGPVCNLYASAQFWWTKGNLNYWEPAPGAIGANPNEIDGWNVRVGKGFNFGPNWMWTPYVGGGNRYWDRNLTLNGNPAGGYDEVYKHDYIGAGLLVQWSPAPRWVVSANGFIGTTFNADETSSPIPGGVPTINYTYPLGSSPIYMLGGALDYAINEHWHANASVDYTRYDYIASLPAPNLFAGPGAFELEPTSHTAQVTLSMGLGYGW